MLIPRAEGQTVRYAQCSSDCLHEDRWRTVDVKDVGWDVQAPELEVDSLGRARVSWMQTDSPAASAVWFSQCEEDCLSAEKWHVFPLHRLTSGASGGNTLSVGALGEVRRVVSDLSVSSPGTHVLSCDGGCSAPERWTATRLGHFSLAEPSIVVDRQGVQHVVGILYRESRLQYGRCVRDCEAPRAWSWVDLGSAAGAPALVIDSVGRARIGVTRGQQIGLWSCSSGCSFRKGWTSEVVTQVDRASDLQLALDAADRPLVAFSERDRSRVRIATCAYGCQGSEGTWVGTDIEAEADAAAAGGVVRRIVARGLITGTGGVPRLLFEKGWTTEPSEEGQKGASSLWLAAGE